VTWFRVAKWALNGFWQVFGQTWQRVRSLCWSNYGVIRAVCKEVWLKQGVFGCKITTTPKIITHRREESLPISSPNWGRGGRSSQFGYSSRASDLGVLDRPLLFANFFQMEIGKGSIFKSKVFYILLAIVIFAFIGAFMDDGSSTSQQNTPSPKTQFSAISKARFDDIAKGFNEATPGELKSIECVDDCTSVVYFHFNTLPSDLQTVIRAQAMTFSNAKLENTGTSNVTVFATVGDRTVYKCNASKGVVKECK